MSGRGRGRGGRGGRGSLPPSVASASFSYGSNGTSSNGAPSSTTTGPFNFHTPKTEPSHKFPPILIPEAPKIESFTDFELKSVEYSDRLDSLLKLSASFRPLKSDKAKIDRYSDKYLSHLNSLKDRKESLSSIKTNLDFFPDELHSVYGFSGTLEGNKIKRQKSSTSSLSVSFNETISQLDHLAQKESTAEDASDEDGAERGEKNEDGEDVDGVEGEIEDEEFEDDTDYNVSYFDNGDDFNGDYDDNGNDEAVF